MTLDLIILVIIGLVMAAGLQYGIVAVVRSVRQTIGSADGRMPAAFDVTGGFLRFPSSGSRAWVVAAVGLLSLWLSSEYWATAKRKEDKRAYRQDIEKGHEEVQAAYEAAAQPTTQMAALAIKQGYVYLGQCDKQWTQNSSRFTRLPPCTEQVPSDGCRIISRKGDVIRASIPENINGKRQLGPEVARVSAGYSVVLRKMFPVSVFSSGPQYYWGLVDFPAESPPER